VKKVDWVLLVVVNENKKNRSNRYVLSLNTGKVKEDQSKKEKKRKTDFQKSYYYIGLVGQIGFSIALPIVAGAMIGSFVDQKYSTNSRATLIGLIIGVIVSIIAFVKTVLTVLEDK